MSTFSKIFVLYPRGVRTGGPEALHQLVDALRSLGQDAWLVPLPDTAGAARVAGFARYDAPEATAIEDSPGNAIVVPEMALEHLAAIRHATPICWWLSIDNSDIFREERQFTTLWDSERTLRTARPVLRAKQLARRIRWAVNRRGIDFRRTLHLTQSVYARAYLSAVVDARAAMLSDYTNYDDIAATPNPSADSRRPSVAFNPAKAAAITSLLEQRLPEIEFVPIQRMSREEVIQTLKSSMMYLDLGNHPGKDRMPREAALCGAISLIARRGSGAFPEDVPIPWEHSVSITPDVLESAIEVIQRVVAAPQRHSNMQEDYRAWIRDEKTRFVLEVDEAFVRGHFAAGIPNQRADG